MSVRRQIIARLRRAPASLKDLAAELGLREKEVADHLGHALRSLDAGEVAREAPAACLTCGFTFRKRERLTTPGRCPVCRSERIDPAVFRIEDRNG